MDKQRGLTRAEVVVVIIIIVAFILLFRIFIPANKNKSPEQGKRAVCLGNLKQLQLAWTLYADDNKEKIVCGEVYNGVKGTNGVRKASDGNEPYWTGDDVVDSSSNTQLLNKEQISAIKSGALFRYIKSEKSYRCPFGNKGEMRTYAIVDSMNGTFRGLEDKTVDNIPLYIKKTTDINLPAKRIVFIDVGRATHESFAVNYDKEQWQDPAPVRHNNGITLSFADGHAELWRWKGSDTIANSKSTKPQKDFQPTTKEGLEDLQKFQIGVWGRLGY
jgi:prepilin-type processing-associated H-X9-DG protein